MLDELLTQARPKLLVVDDQTVNIQILFRVFSADHQVFMATGGEQALAVCAASKPDLVLLDVMMPGMDGYEVCRRLKSNPDTCDIPVIFVTGNSDTASEEQGLDAGAVDFITKPINPRIVRARVKLHLTLKVQSDFLRSLAFIDGLTGVHNRRYFDAGLEAEWSRNARHRSTLSLILLDVDFFKRYNDHYGHQAGDDCLKRLATEFKASLKQPGDRVARYGGEEFIFLLPDTDFETAIKRAEALRAAVLALQLPHATSEASPFVTVSLGISSSDAPAATSKEALLQLADVRLYAAKAAGRNQVSFK